MLQQAVALDATLLDARYAVSRVLLRLGREDDARRELAVFERLQREAMEPSAAGSRTTPGQSKRR